MLDASNLFFRQPSAFKKRLAYCALLLFFLAAPVQPLPAKDLATTEPNVSKEIAAIIVAKQHPYLKLGTFQNRKEDIDDLYKMANYQLIWLGNKQPEKNTRAALQLLGNAAVHGLNPANYDAETLTRRLGTAGKPGPDAVTRAALYDTALSLALLRFLHDLHYGRVNPQGINFNLKLREQKLVDLPALIHEALTHGTIAQLPVLVEPKLKQYQKLKQALTRYRKLAAEMPGFELTTEKPIRPGNELPKKNNLHLFLTALGDLPKDKVDNPALNAPLYTGKIVAGVKNFQQRHGLSADGIIGKETLAAFKVPLTHRVKQIELAMERLRWLPELSDDPSIIVNIPAFQLWAADDINKLDGDILNMKVVVGKALENQTPVLMAEMRFIDFMPYWNIPYNILKNEILPKLSQNPDYLGRENLELVPRFGNEVKAVAYNKNSRALLKQGALKVRQRPGPKNALGRVKFIFPNQNDVYLHDTPANAMFAKSRRDFSHGCVRVEKPEQLAEFVLKNQEKWSKEAVQEALQTPKTQRVLLNKPVPVLFFYTTSFFDQHDNLAFYDDIYGHDAVLQLALEKPGDVSDQSLFISKSPEPVPVAVVK